MSYQFTRRELLRQGAVAVGLAAAGERVLAAPTSRDTNISAPSFTVSIQRCGSYEPRTLMPSLTRALDLIGGIQPTKISGSIALTHDAAFP